MNLTQKFAEFWKQPPAVIFWNPLHLFRMDENLRYYLEGTRVSEALIESRLSHPITGQRYKERTAYVLLRKYADDFLKLGAEPRFIGLAGLRGVGKTTLMWHTAEYIYHTYKDTCNIYFFNVNTIKNLGVDLFGALQAFQKYILNKRFNVLSTPITLLFDEVHDDGHWSNTLKILYDEARTALVYCTGSSALLLNQTADLTRRMRIEKIYPFKFTEFITAKTYLLNSSGTIYPERGLAENLKNALFFSETPREAQEKLNVIENKTVAYFKRITTSGKLKIRDLWQEYMNYHNIPAFLFFKDRYTITESIRELFKRVIWEDIPKLRPDFTEFVKTERLLLRMAGSDEINPDKLGGIVGLKQNDLNDLIEILAKAELLNVLLPFGGLDTKIVRNRKAFFMSPSLRKALLASLYGPELPAQLSGKLLEDLVVMYLKRTLKEGFISFFSTESSVHPDFVIETRDKPLLLELSMGKTSLKQLHFATDKFRYGILVSGSVNKPGLHNGILQIPLSWFLLL